MRLMFLLCVFYAHTTYAQEVGVVIEEIGSPSVLESVGVQPGDLFTAWELMPSPPLHEGASGSFETIFHWYTFLNEQVPRGLVTLSGKRNGELLEIQVPPGDWFETSVIPVIPAHFREAYLQGRNLVGEGKVEQGIQTWRSVLMNPALKDTLACWLWIETANLLARQNQWDATFPAFEAAERHAERPMSQMALWTARGEAHVKQNQLELAEECYGRALQIGKEFHGGGLGVSRIQFELGALYIRRGKLTEGRAISERAIRIQEQLAPQSLFLADSLGSLAIVAAMRGDLIEAEKMFKQVLPIKEKLAPGSLTLAVTLNRLGNIKRFRGALDHSETYYKQSLAILEKQNPESHFVAGVLNNMGVLSKYRGDLESAFTYYERSLLIKEALKPGSLELASTVSNFGALLVEQGDWDRAVEYYKQAQAIEEKLAPDSLKLSYTLLNMGQVFQFRGDFNTAEAYFARALTIRETQAPGSLDVSNALTNLGVLAQIRGHLKKAVDYMERAYAIQKEVDEDAYDTVYTLLHLGVLARDQGDLETAIHYCNQALALIKDYAYQRIRLEAYSTMGSIFHRLNDDTSAMEHHQHALALIEKGMFPGMSAAQTHYATAKTHEKFGRVAEAEHHFGEAVSALEFQLNKLGGTSRDKTLFQGRAASYYRDYIAFLVAQGKTEKAFNILEHARARVLRQIMGERELVLSGSEIPVALERMRKSAAHLYEIKQQELANLDFSKDMTRAETLKSELLKQRTLYYDVLEDIRKISPKLADLHHPPSLDLDRVKKELKPGSLLLSYSVHEQQIFLFVVGKAQPLNVHTIARSEAWLRETMKDLTIAVKQPKSETAFAFFQELASRLYQELLAPAAAAMEAADELIIIPDGPLSSLPFGALIKSVQQGRPQYLIEDLPLTNAVSASIYFQLKQRPVTEGGRLAAFGDPVYPVRPEEEKETWSQWAGRVLDKLDVRSQAVLENRGATLKPLPATAEEVGAVADIFGQNADVYLGEKALEERAKGLGANIGTVHFACHGIVDHRTPLNSSLALTTNTDFKRGEENGFLQAWEIFESVRLNANLVVLSACETALGQETGVEGLVGLTRAFQFAGARSIVATCWPINDTTTALFMKRFYTHLKAGTSVHQSLRKTQREFINGKVSTDKGILTGLLSRKGPDLTHPFYWAAFQVHGPGD